MRSAVLLVAVVALSASPGEPPPQPDRQQPSFRSSTVVVEVSAVITHEGEPVTDIRRDEVVVRDEGVPQELVAFEYVDLRDAASNTAGSTLDSQTLGMARSRGRDYVLLLDDLHISPRLTRPTMDVAHALIDALAPEDRLAIVNTGPHDLVLQLSTDREAAKQRVSRFRGQRGTGMAPGPNEVEIKTLILLRVLRGIADAMAGDASERRSVLLVSEGQSLGPADPRSPGDYHDVWRAYEQVVAAASAANVAVYAINPRGLEAPVPLIGTGGNRDAAQVAGSTAQRVTDAMVSRYYGTLGRISASTGGTLTADSNALRDGVSTMLRDSRQYYRLAYRQPDVASDAHGKARSISVSVNRPGVDVRARSSYVPQ